MVNDGARSESVAERFAELRRTIRPAGLRPGVGGGLSLMLASVGSYVWTAVRFDEVDDQTMTVVSAVACEPGDEVVVRCSGAEVGDVGFRMRVEQSAKLEDASGFRLRLKPTALSQMNTGDAEFDGL